MELKFTATIDMSPLDVRKLIEEEVRRKHKDVKVTGVEFITHMPQVGIQIGFPAHQPSATLSGVRITVERTER